MGMGGGHLENIITYYRKSTDSWIKETFRTDSYDLCDPDPPEGFVVVSHTTMYRYGSAEEADKRSDFWDWS